MNSALTQERPIACFKAHIRRKASDLVGLRLSKAIFVLLLALIVLTAIPYGTVEPWWISIFICSTFGLSILWIVEGLLSGAWFVKEHRLLIPLVIVAAFAIVQTLPWQSAGELAGVNVRYAISADPYETWFFTFRLIALTLLGALLLRYTSSRARLIALVYVVFALGLSSAIFGLVRQTTQLTSDTSFFLPHLLPGIGYGLFINDNHFAFLMDMSLGLTLGLLVGGGVRRTQMILCIAGAGIIWIALLQSQSRGGIFSMICQVVFLSWMFFTVRLRQTSISREFGAKSFLCRIGRPLAIRITLALSLVLIIGIGIVWVGGEPVVIRMENVSTIELSGKDPENRTNTLRKHIWRATWELIKDNPVAGVGFGGYWMAISKYHDASGEYVPQQAHNDYLEVLASGGLVGLALLVWFGIVFIRRARMSLRVPDPFCRAAALGAMAGLLAAAVHSIVDFGLHITINAVIFMALASIAVVSDKIEALEAEV